MSQDLDINGVRFESASAIAGRFPYTQDYIGRLAREGKVNATKVGRRWFIDTVSFEAFLEEVEENKKKRAAELRAERREEREQVVVVEEVPVTTQEEKTENIISPYHLALAEAVAVVLCGFFVGTLGWFMQSEGMQLADLAGGAQLVTQQVGEVLVLSLDGAAPEQEVASVIAASPAAVSQVTHEEAVFAVFPAVTYEEIATTTETVRWVIDMGNEPNE